MRYAWTIRVFGFAGAERSTRRSHGVPGFRKAGTDKVAAPYHCEGIDLAEVRGVRYCSAFDLSTQDANTVLQFMLAEKSGVQARPIYVS